MIEDYEKSIEKIEERLAQLRMMDNISKYDRIQLIELYEEELNDLYAIVRYLRSPAATKLFPTIERHFTRDCWKSIFH